MTDFVEVGKNRKKTVTKEDAALFKVIINFMDHSADNTKEGYWHYGKFDLGALTTYLLDNYNITPKESKND